MSCCNYSPYDQAFDAQRAQRELRDFLAAGPMASSQLLLDALSDLPLEGKSLLDVGGGIGAVTFELFQRGIHSATHVDISRANVDAFRSEAASRSLSEKIVSLQGDFATLHEEVSPADLVVLDKVLCCYPDYASLLSRSASKACRWYVYSIPRDRWWVRIYFFFDGWLDRMRGRYIPLYFHPARAIDRMLNAAGFTSTKERLVGKWRVAVFEKK